jgi:ketosteroid isomerase-like protein
MCVTKRTVVVWGLAVVSLAFLVGFLGMPRTTRPAAAETDWCAKLQQEADAVNRGEIDLALEDYADDVVFQATPICDEAECAGKDALRSYFQYLVDTHSQMTIASCEVAGNTVTVTYEFVMDSVRAAGVERIVSSVAYEFEGDKLSSSRQVGMDFSDPQTLQYVQYAAGRPRPTFEMGPGRDADQSPGNVEMYEYPDFVGVFFRIAPGPAGVPQPAQIHEGTCANLGPVAFALRDVDGGVSHTVLRGLSLSDLQTSNHAIAVQKSQEEPDVYVACADIPAAAAAVPPAAPAPPAEQAPAIAPAPAAALPSTGSGGLLGEEGRSLPTWWYALAAGGALLLAAGLAREAMTRYRR